MSVAVIIVNYRTPDLVIQCLESLKAERDAGVDLHAFVGDSCSPDDSAEKLQKHVDQACDGWATFASIDHNGGFAYGNNFLVRKFVLQDERFTHVHFLNPDAYVHAGAVSALAECLDGIEEAGFAGSALEGPDGGWRASAFRFPSLWREFTRGVGMSLLEKAFPSANGVIHDVKTQTRVDWVSGASFMIKRRVLDEVGLMDDRYFLYFEEIDFMYRGRVRGWETWHVPASRVVHLEGESTGVQTDHSSEKPLPSCWYHSRYRFFSKNLGLVAAYAGSALWLAGHLLKRIRFFLFLRRYDGPPGMVWGLFRHGFRSRPECS